MENSKSKMLLATLSQCVANRDKAAANIAFILEHGCPNIDDNISVLKREFEKISQEELTIEAIQVYYSKYCPLPQAQNPIEKKEEKENDNNS
jgi:hypothetical protein